MKLINMRIGSSFPLPGTNQKQELENFFDWGTVRCLLMSHYQGEPRGFVSDSETTNLVVWQLLQGNVRLRFGDFQLEASAGCWVVITHGRRFQKFSSDARIASTHLYLDTGGAEWVGPPAARLEANPGLRHASAGLAKFVFARYPEGFPMAGQSFQPKSFAEQAETQGKVWALCEQLLPGLGEAGIRLETAGLSDPRVARSLAAIESMPLESAWDRDRIARVAGLSPSQLDRNWREARGQTPFQYWELRRVRFARERLENSSWSIKEIASALGFVHLSQFSNWFRGRQSVSPRAYRQLFVR